MVQIIISRRRAGREIIQVYIEQETGITNLLINNKKASILFTNDLFFHMFAILVNYKATNFDPNLDPST